MTMKTYTPDEMSIRDVHRHLLGSIGPRPICFASTIDKNGTPNLSPFSFFNVFSAKPPIVIFSPARSGRTGQTKNTHDNVLEVPEVVINVVTYNIVHQMSLASSPYPKGVNEFEKAGFTPIESEVVQPPRVKESPIQMECKVIEVKELGQNGGAGNLVIAEVVKIHTDENILGENGYPDQEKIDLIGRMGGNFYCRANGPALFEVTKPLTTIGIGIDALPDKIKFHTNLSGNELGQLGGVESLPTSGEIEQAAQSLAGNDPLTTAKELLQKNRTEEALATLMNL
jgi:flavin reductase (DIM6/NTAB) family NADH-FMN oxidoreductase RutF